MDELIEAYRNEPGPVGTRAELLLRSLVSFGRLVTIKTQGPAFGLVNRELKRVLSFREHSVGARRGTISYFPRNVDESQAPEDRQSFDTKLQALGFNVPAARESPGHADLGSLAELRDATFQGLLALLDALGPMPASDIGEPSPALRRTVVANRIVRDTAIVRALKLRYDNTCQLCGSRVSDPTGNWTYSEGHHLRPLGAPHNGSDTEDNILIVCPNCHAMLDFAVIPFKSNTLKLSRHALNPASVSYHNRLCRERSAA